MSPRGRKSSGPRSEEERQRARLEREQRRAQREGRPVPRDLDEIAPEVDAGSGEPAAPFADPTPAPPEEAAPPFADPTPAPPEGTPWWSTAAPSGPAIDVSDALRPPAPPAGDPQPSPRAASSPAGSAGSTEPPRRPAPAPAARHRDPEPFSAFTDEHDAIGLDDPADEPLAPLRPSASAIPPIQVAPRKAPARRGWSRIAAVLVLLPIALLIAAAIVLFQPFKGDPGAPVSVTIAPGSSVTQIGEKLADEGVIDNALVFSLRARMSGGGADLRAGKIELRENMSYAAALTALRDVPVPDPVINVTVPEGLSRREVAAQVKKADVSGDYLRASRRSAGFDPKEYGQPKKQSGLEGFLFPATYELPRGGATAKALVAKQVESFEQQFATVDMRRAKRAKLSPYEVLIIASMIEREVNIPAERRKVAAVIYNRLKDGMTLGIDATIRYAERNWTRPLKVSELERDGPFNTRTRTGLPPTPIGNPGLASIKAAANPARESYLYYVVKPCGNGTHAFSSSDAQFERDRQAYNRAREQRGGDPSVCKDDD
ncbi:MAG: endolytic transglycosylase MltG [Patulibacter sp.]|nr:endolytic transglycosylase MltG [Patulibacter sp.]